MTDKNLDRRRERDSEKTMKGGREVEREKRRNRQRIRDGKGQREG